MVANTIFTQSLISETTRLVPSINPADVLRAGGSADAIRSLAPAGSPELAGLLRVFANSFDTICYLMVALSAISAVASFGVGWVDIRPKAKANTAAAAEV